MNCRLRRLHLFVIFLIFGLVCPQMNAVSWFPFGPDGGDARAVCGGPAATMRIFIWARRTDGFTSRGMAARSGSGWRRVGKRDDLVIRHILVDPADPKHLVVGAYVVADGGGIYISNDGGATWTSAAGDAGQSVRSLTFAPSDPKIMVAGTLEGVFRSTDGGAHWERISPKDSAEIHEVESLAVDPREPEHDLRRHVASSLEDDGRRRDTGPTSSRE